jgi:hypothetical protein
MADLFKKGDLVMVMGEVKWVDGDENNMKIEMPKGYSIFVNQTDAVMHRAAFAIDDLVVWDGGDLKGVIIGIDKNHDVAWVMSFDQFHTEALGDLSRPDPDFDEIEDRPPLSDLPASAPTGDRLQAVLQEVLSPPRAETPPNDISPGGEPI